VFAPGCWRINRRFLVSSRAAITEAQQLTGGEGWTKILIVPGFARVQRPDNGASNC